MISLIVLSILAYNITDFLQYTKEKDIQQDSKNSMDMIVTAYNSIINTHKISTQKDMNSLMKNRAVLQLLQEFKYADDTNKSIIRGKLYRLLYQEYNQMKNFGIRQFHFHTHDGKSLLRFHKPSFNGDSLIDIRESIRVANRENKKVSGFEGGKIYPGFRYVFPINDHGEHLGSVEFSISFESIEKELAEVLPHIGYQLNLSKKISYEKVFPWNREYFIPSIISNDYCIENPKISAVTKKLQRDQEVEKLEKYIKNHAHSIRNKIKEAQNFILPIMLDDMGYMIQFMVIKDTKNMQAAYLVIYSKFDELITINYRYNIFFFILYTTLFLILILIYIVTKQFEDLSLQKENLQHLLNLQEQIVILTNGEKITYANQKFFEFFNFKNLQQFLNRNECICEKFIHDDRFFHLGKVADRVNWVNAIQLLPQSQRVVAMAGEDMQLSTFSVSVNIYEHNIFILTFTDISDTMTIQIKLQEKTLHDKLTHSYNREYFEQNIEQIISEYTKLNGKLAVGMLDIDFFKNVNDTYGHAIGDQVLVELVTLINKSLRESDILIRWGGEEFVLLIKVYTMRGLKTTAEHLRSAIENHHFETIEQITCSIGYSFYRDDEDIKDTIKRADDALYKAKSLGRNRVEII